MSRASLVVLLLAAGCSGDDGGLVRVDSAGYFNPTSLDFGVQPIPLPNKLPVRFTNASADEAKIQTIVYEPTTNAFGVKLADQRAFRNTALGAGGSEELEVTFAPDREGPYSVTMVVQTETLEIPLALTGVGRRVEPTRFEVNPASVSFSDVVVGGEAVQRVTVTNRGEAPGAILRAPSMPPFFVRAEGGGALPNTDIDPDASTNLEIAFRPISAASFEDTLFVETADGTKTEVTVSGTAVVAGTLMCDVADIAFGSVVRGQTARRTVSCTADGSYTVASIDAGHLELTVENVSPPIGANVQSLTFEVLFAARGIAHEVESTLTIAPTFGAPVTIAITGMTVAPPPAVVDLQVAVAWPTGVDLDTHLVREGGLPFMLEHDCHYEAPTIDWNTLGDATDDPFLDSDITIGPGTERISMTNGAGGTYEVYVFYNQHPNAAPTPTLTTVTIHLRGQSDVVRARTLSACGTLWHVGTVRHGANPPRFDVVDTESAGYAPRADCNN